DKDGDDSDWIEIHNPTFATVNLNGWSLTDNATDLAKWQFPAVGLGAGDYLVVFASGKNLADPQGELHTNFKLSSDGEYLALVEPGATTAAHEYAPAYPQQFADVSYGMTQELDGFLVPDSAAITHLVPTVAQANVGTAWTELGYDDSSWNAYGRISRVLVTEARPDSPDYVEIQNVSNSTVDTTGWTVVANDTSHFDINAWHTTLWQLPGSIAAGETLYRTSDSEDVAHYWGPDTSGNEFGWFTQGPGWVLILDGDGRAIDFVVWGYDDSTLASFDVDVAGHRITIADVWTGSAPPPHGSRDNSLQRDGGSDHDNATDWAFRAPPSMNVPNTGLRTPFVTDIATGIGFDASATGVGDPDLGDAVQVDVQAAMYQQNGSLWARFPFTVDDPLTLDAIQLQMKYNDGFIAYLNGQLVAQSNAPPSPDWNAVATADREVAESLEYDQFDLTQYQELLQPGVNVLAIHGLNFAPGDPDFLILPDLVQAGRRYFGNPTPDAMNSAGFLDYVKDTQFSVDRGFFDAPQDVAITSNTPGATIIYTLDGSEPTASPAADGTATHGTEYTGPIHVTATTMLRAMALKENMKPSNVDTQTYIFPSDVLTQTRPAGYPTATENPSYRLDYDVDPRVVNDPRYADEFLDDLAAIPSVSLVMDVDDLFGISRGIYANAMKSGLAWERATSVEYIDPVAGEQFQIDSAIRIQGAYSRNPVESPKHAFRLIFKAPYGPTDLEYKMFDDTAVDKFEQLILRMSTHDAWHVHQDAWRADATYAADQWHRATQLAMGHLSGHSKHVHLYLNGLYWGLYEIEERPNAAFAASHLGGERDEYDAVNSGQLRDGTLDAWNTMNRIAAGQGQHGSLVNHAAYEELKQYLDVVAFADYLIMNIYSGNMDWPGKNYYAVRKREPEAGFQFVAWDSEASFWKTWGGSPPAASAAVWNELDYPYFNTTSHGAGYLYNRLKNNAEFRMLLADRLHRHLDNDGILTPTRAADMYQQQLDKVWKGLVPESARWGDAWRSSQPYTRDTELAANVDWLFDNFFPVRSDNVLGYFRSDGMYPSVTAPMFNQHGGWMPEGFELTLNAPAGTIYYSLDGTDPRAVGGAVAPRALVYLPGMEITLTEGTVVKARTRSGGTWSALNEAAFSIGQPATAENLVVTEINYNPVPPTTAELAIDDTWTNTAFEFIELQNVGPDTISLAGAQFTAGIRYTFGDVVELDPGQRIVVAANPQAFATRYDTTNVLVADGNYTGALDSNGERIRLGDDLGGEIFDFSYNDTGSWPGRADGKGATLELLDPTAVPHNDPARSDYLGNGENWHSSVRYGGTPGTDGDAPVGIAINEVISHTDLPLRDAVELVNTSSEPIDLFGWYLSADWGWDATFATGNNKRFRIPE
ncbi:MAG: lamin tail domain-containing protein, partial [Candidatus Nealsonbacteria bacterium]|nr:lamin tail domain-containing protein [Candidatus Nealsonbacteria bacterium]